MGINKLCARKRIAAITNSDIKKRKMSIFFNLQVYSMYTAHVRARVLHMSNIKILKEKKE